MDSKVILHVAELGEVLLANRALIDVLNAACLSADTVYLHIVILKVLPCCISCLFTRQLFW